MEDHSEYQYAVVLGTQESRDQQSFLNIEDMLFEVSNVSMALWVYGSVSVWHYGSMVVWVGPLVIKSQQIITK